MSRTPLLSLAFVVALASAASADIVFL